MQINNIPEAFQSRIRLAIVSALLTGEKTFNQIKEITGASDGNLSVHLTKLEEIDYVQGRKEFVHKKPLSTYSLTTLGRRDFEQYVRLLEQVLKNSQT